DNTYLYVLRWYVQTLQTSFHARRSSDLVVGPVGNGILVDRLYYADMVIVCREKNVFIRLRFTGQYTDEIGKRQCFNCIGKTDPRSEEHTSELQSRENIVCRLLLEKKTNR